MSSFVWMVELHLDRGQVQEQYVSVTDFCGPHAKRIMADAVLAAACVGLDWLQPIGETILEQLLANTYDADTWMNRPDASDSPLLRPGLRRAWATAVAMRPGGSHPTPLFDTGLKLWLSAPAVRTAQHSAGHVRPAWLAHEEHIVHLAGTGDDFLLLKYPWWGSSPSRSMSRWVAGRGRTAALCTSRRCPTSDGIDRLRQGRM